MALQIATNTFLKGMIMDSNELESSNEYTINSLNASVATFNGNEGAILNEFGNIKIDEAAKLPDEYIPIGSVEYGGVIYIASINKQTNEKTNEEINRFQLGSFPSPSEDGFLKYEYKPLQVGLKIDEGNEITTGFETDLFDYDLNHPINIQVEPSYDGSLNLILNDGKNEPRLINTGFHVQDNNRCSIIERYDSNNTNRYNIDDKQKLLLQTSLYRNTSRLSYFEYEGSLSGGKLSAGNYTFYAIACDKDGNESDVICESGVISVFFGTEGDPFSATGSLGLENTLKSVKFTIKNIDDSYQYIKLCYTIATAQDDLLSETVAYKIKLSYKIIEKECLIIFTGYEDKFGIDVLELSIPYFHANSVKAQAINLNILFLANIQLTNGESSSEFETLRNFSLRIVPKLEKGPTIDLDLDYKTNGEKNYYNSKFIYNYTGYHDEEFYRFGIVYIRSDNSTTLVFNVLGVNNLTLITDLNNKINLEDLQTSETIIKDNFNNKGVCKINADCNLKDVLGITFNIPNTEELGKNYKGFFFVRQKRIPTILALAYTTNVCEESFLPAINIKGKEDLKRYLYESFAQGAFRVTSTGAKDYNNFYPKKLAKSRQLRLTNSFENRLFTLTENSYCYFDKIPSGSAVGVYLSEIGAWGTDHWKTGSKMSLYGGQDEDLYAAFIGCNTVDETRSTYRTGIVFYEKLNLKDKDYEIIKNGESITGYILKINFSDTVTLTTEESGIYNKWEAPEYKDASWMHNVIKCYTTMVTNEKITSESGITYYDYIYLEGLFYKYKYAAATHSEYASTVNNRMRSAFEDLMKKDTMIEYSSEGSFDSKNGYDLEVPTFDGKYGYSKSLKGNDVQAFPLNPIESNSYAAFCPEFELNTPYYNNLFSGGNFVTKIKYTTNWMKLSNNKRLFYVDTYKNANESEYYTTNAISVLENISLLPLTHGQNIIKENSINRHNTCYFSTKAGDATKCNFSFAGSKFLAYVFPTNKNNPFKDGDKEYKLKTEEPFNLLRGIYGPYVGIYPYKISNLISSSDSGITSIVINTPDDYSGNIINIYIPNYNITNTSEYIKVRANDESAYYTISDKIDITESSVTCYRGDCFIGYFTHRINRNFQDSTAPYNDTIIDNNSFNKGFEGCFDETYRTFDLTKEDSKYFNIGDINAVKLGTWVTFPVRSSMNISLRSKDSSYIDEKLLCGNDRSYYPLHGIDSSGSYKIPESTSYNSGYDKSGGDKLYYNINFANYDKKYYKNRIVYSNVLQSGVDTNGHRIFLLNNYSDYTDLYGEIVKLLSLGNYLIVICERGILRIPVNERALLTDNSSRIISIGNSGVLPDSPDKIISDTYGSQWTESIIQTPYGIYGVDAQNKKIWYTDGNTIEIISDFKIQEFLNNYLNISKNLTIKECNIKSFYIKYKNDVIFTLYDKDKDNYWNICWNINDKSWRTFYSWIPLLGENIGNNFISTDLFNDGENYLWKHGHSQSIKTDFLSQPTNWYGKIHPFEIEFIVKDSPQLHKIFDNLQIISNNVMPESFHYEIVGDCFDFSNLKKDAFIRQERLKQLYNENIEDKISFVDTNSILLQYDFNSKGRTIIFPQYYTRQDKINQIYDSYCHMLDGSHDYRNLSGTEIIKYDKLKEYRLCNHVKAVDVKDSLLRGNSYYKEDKWNIQINPINYLIRNEPYNSWIDGRPPIVIPDIKLNPELSQLIVPSSLINDNIITRWDIQSRKEVKIKDKYLKVKIRYSGNDLAIISAINTLYTISNA